MIRGQSATVLRAEGKDRHGDGQMVNVGTVDVLILPATWTATDGKQQETATTELLAWAPRRADVKLRHRDRLKVGDVTYAVESPAIWDHKHPMSGHDFTHYAVQVRAVV